MSKLEIKKWVSNTSLSSCEAARVCCSSLCPFFASYYVYSRYQGESALWRSLKQREVFRSSSVSGYSCSSCCIICDSERCITTAGPSSFSSTSSRKNTRQTSSKIQRHYHKPKQQYHSRASPSESFSSKVQSASPSSSSEEKVLSEVFSSFSRENKEKKLEEPQWLSDAVPKFNPKPFPVDKFLSIQSRTIDQFIQLRKEILDRHVKLVAARKEQLRRFYASWKETRRRRKGSPSMEENGDTAAHDMPSPPPPPLSLPLAQELEVLERKVLSLEAHQGFLLTDELLYRHFHLLIELGAYGPALQWLDERVLASQRLGPPFPNEVLDGLVAIARNVRQLFPDASSDGLRVPIAALLTSVSGSCHSSHYNGGDVGTNSGDIQPFPFAGGSLYATPLSPSFNSSSSSSSVPFEVEFTYPITTSVVRKAQSMSSLLSRTAASAMPLHGKAAYLDQLVQLYHYFMNRSPRSSSASSSPLWSWSSSSALNDFSFKERTPMENNKEGREEDENEEEEDLSLASQTLQPPNPFFYPNIQRAGHLLRPSPTSSTDAGASPTADEATGVSHRVGQSVGYAQKVSKREDEDKRSEERTASIKEEEEADDIGKAEWVDELLGIPQLASFFLHRGDGGSGAVDNLAPPPPSASLFLQQMHSPRRYPPPPPPLHPSYVHHLVLVYLIPLLHVFEKCGLLFDSVSRIRNGSHEEEEDGIEKVETEADSRSTAVVPDCAERISGVKKAFSSSSSGFPSRDWTADVMSSFIPIGPYAPSQVAAVQKVRRLFPSFGEKMFDLNMENEEEGEAAKGSFTSRNNSRRNEEDNREDEPVDTMEEDDERLSSLALTSLKKTLELYAHMVQLVCESKEPTLIVLIQMSLLAGFFHLEPQSNETVSLFHASENHTRTQTAEPIHSPMDGKELYQKKWSVENENAPDAGATLVPVVSEEIWLHDIALGHASDMCAEEVDEGAEVGDDQHRSDGEGMEERAPTSSQHTADMEAGRYLLHHFLQESFLQLSIARQAIFTERVGVWRTVDILQSFGALENLWRSVARKARAGEGGRVNDQRDDHHLSAASIASSWLHKKDDEEKQQHERERAVSEDHEKERPSRVSPIFLCRAFQCWHYEWARTEVGHWVEKKYASYSSRAACDLSSKEKPMVFHSASGKAPKTSSFWMLQGSPALSCSYLPLFTRPSSYYPFLYGNHQFSPTSAQHATFSAEDDVREPSLVEEEKEKGGRLPLCDRSVQGEGSQQDHASPLPSPRAARAPPIPRLSGGRVQPAHQSWHELWQEVEVVMRDVLGFQASSSSPDLGNDGEQGGCRKSSLAASPVDVQRLQAIRDSEWKRTAGTILTLICPTTCPFARLHGEPAAVPHGPRHVLEEMNRTNNAVDAGVLHPETESLLLANREWQAALQHCLLLQQHPAQPPPLSSSECSFVTEKQEASSLSTRLSSLPRCYTAVAYADILRQLVLLQEHDHRTGHRVPSSSPPLSPMAQRMRVVQWEALVERVLLALSLDLHHILLSVSPFPAFYGEASSPEEGDGAPEEGEGEVGWTSPAATLYPNPVPTPDHGGLSYGTPQEVGSVYYQEEVFHEIEEDVKEENEQEEMTEARMEESATPPSLSEMKTGDGDRSPDGGVKEGIEEKNTSFTIQKGSGQPQEGVEEGGMAHTEEQPQGTMFLNSVVPCSPLSPTPIGEERGVGGTGTGVCATPSSSSTKLCSSTLNYLRLTSTRRWAAPSGTASSAHVQPSTNILYTPPSVEEVGQVLLQTIEGLIALLQQPPPPAALSVPLTPSPIREEEEDENEMEQEEETEGHRSAISPAALSALALVLDACYWITPVTVSPSPTGPSIGMPSTLSQSSISPGMADNSLKKEEKRTSKAVLQSLLFTLFPLLDSSFGRKAARGEGKEEHNPCSPPTATVSVSSSASVERNSIVATEADGDPHGGKHPLVASSLSPWYTSSTPSTLAFSPDKNNGNAMALMTLAAARAGLWEEVETLLSALFHSDPPPGDAETKSTRKGAHSPLQATTPVPMEACSAVQMDPSILVSIFLEARKAGVSSVCLLLREHREDLFFS